MPRTLPTTIGTISQCLPFHIETGSTLCSYSHIQLPCSGPLTNTENARVCSAQDYQLQFPSKFPVPALATDLMKDFFSLIKLFLIASGLTDTPSKASAHTENHTSEALCPRALHTMAIQRMLWDVNAMPGVRLTILRAQPAEVAI